MSVVVLSEAEIIEADTLGRERHRVGELTSENSQVRPDLRGNQIELRLSGYRAERAVFKYLGLSWDSYETDMAKRFEGDCAGMEVRCTKYWSGHLLVYPDDNLTRKFILVVDRHPQYILIGWLYGFEATKFEFDKDLHRPAWYVPKTGLNPISQLI